MRPDEMEISPMPPHKLEHLTWMNQRFGGKFMQQTWTALYMLESLLNSVKFQCIIELGSGEGALSKFFRLHNPATTHNFEIKRWCFEDVFLPHVIQHIKWVTQKKRTLFFCDDGDKPRELRTYLPIAKKGDHVMVHDWKRPDGLWPKDIEWVVVRLSDTVETYRQDEFDEMKTYILSLRVIK